MKHHAMLCLLLLTVSATSTAQTRWAAGSGYPFGGVAGVQYQWEYQWVSSQPPAVQPQASRQKLLVSAALVGVSVSWQLSVDDQRRHAVGLTVGQEAISADEGFLTLDYLYYPAGFSQPGWFYGASAGSGRYRKGDNPLLRLGNKPCNANDPYRIFCQQPRQQHLVGFLTVGYQF